LILFLRTDLYFILGAVRYAENEAGIISDFSSYKTCSSPTLRKKNCPYLSAIHGTSFRTAKKKLHVVYLKALGLPHQEIVRIARVSGDSVTRYLQAYVEGGVAALCSSQRHCTRSALLPIRSTQNTFPSPSAHTVAEAAYEIESSPGFNWL